MLLESLNKWRLRWLQMPHWFRCLRVGCHGIREWHDVCVCVCVMPDMLSNPSRAAVYQFSTWTLIIYRSVVLGGLKLSSLCLCVWVCVCMNPIGPRDLFSPTLQKNIGHRTPKIKLHYIKETLEAVVKEGTARSIYMSKMGSAVTTNYAGGAVWLSGAFAPVLSSSSF